MTRLQEQVAFIRLEPLTPVHIGAGETLDPLSYVMREEDGIPYLYPVDVAAWVEAQGNPAELATLFGTKSLTEIRAYLAKELTPVLDIYGGAPSQVYSREIFKKYSDELRPQGSPNQLLISPAQKNPVTGGLVIPGSSIKGAIRTAVIDWLDQNWGLGLKDATNRDRRGYESALELALGKISDNAFRDLKVGDFPAGLGESFIITAKEVRRVDNPLKTGTPKNDCEVTLSRSMTGQSYALYGKVALGSHGGGKRDTVLTVSQGNRKQSWDLLGLMDLCNKFYGIRYLKERTKFYTAAHLSATAEALKSVEESLLHPTANAMILRLGHYSHVECMTVTDNQPKTRPVPRGEGQMPHGTTRTLADGKYPFGWARLSVISAEEYAQACARREEADARFLQGRSAKRQAVSNTREAEERQRQERVRQEQERREAEEQARAAMEKMSPEERLIHALEIGTASENLVVELFNKLDSLPDELKARAATAVKGFWVKTGKWDKKKCTDKQWAKVQKVKSLMGER